MRRDFHALCPQCLMPEEGIGYFTSDNRFTRETVWTCFEHLRTARRMMRMNDRMLAEIDKKAREHADEAQGAYLMKIGKFDIRDFTPEEADRHLDIVITAFLDHRSAQLGDEAPF
jgi:hypothetical protein